MADFAQMIYGTADNVTRDIAKGNAEARESGLRFGAEIAEAYEKAKQNRALLEQKKQEIQLAKIDKVGHGFEVGSKIDNPQQQKAYMNGYMPNLVNALGLNDLFHPDSFKMAQAEPLAITYMKTRTQDDPAYLTNTLLPAAADAGKFAELLASNEYKQFKAEQLTQASLQESVGALKKEFDKGRTEQNKTARTQLVADAAGTRQDKDIGATGSKELAKKTAVAYDTYKNGGGQAAAQKSIQAFQEAVTALESGEVKFGTLAKSLPYGATEQVLSRTDPKAKALMDKVRGAINMRERLADPNPTAIQVDAILSRAIDPRLNNAENVKKLRAELTQMRQADDNRVKEFRRQGLLPTPRMFKMSNGKTYSEETLQRMKNADTPAGREAKKLLGE